MSNKALERLRAGLEYPLIRQTRRNHGLEHATIHLLNQRIEGLRIAGRSTNNGFVLIGDVPTEAVEQSTREALARMREGEHDLAVHPNCGTNLVTTGTVTALVGLIGFGRNKRPSLNHFSWMVTWMSLAALVSQPLGANLQRYITTKGDPGDLEIIDVKRREIRWPLRRNPIVTHQIITRKG